MTLKNCGKCTLLPKSSITSSRFKLLTVLKQLHGTRGGARGSTLEDIAMFMVKYYCLDGDVKSQILATLKTAVKLNFVQKRCDKFSLVLPSASLQLASSKNKIEEMERTQCIFPVAWSSISFSEGTDKYGNKTCKRKISSLSPCCDEGEITSENEHKSCECKKKKPKIPICPQDNFDCFDSGEDQNKCNPCAVKKKSVKKKPCPPLGTSACSRKKQKPKKSCNKDNAFDNYCLMCPANDRDEDYCDDSCSKCSF